MGLFDRFKTDRTGPPAKLMSDELAADLKARQDMAQATIAANPGAMPDMTMDPAQWQARAAEDAAYSALVQNVHKRGVEAPGVIRTIQPTGESDLGGGRAVDFVVSVTTAGGEQVDMPVRQHMAAAQLQGLREGGSVVVKYDPDAPTAGLLVGW
ncbi:MAG TPA: DUF3592 domain-containing protein [Solirubrobacteraceae bacterium]|nr:DUF3592 domain-containing protein [Solirubrobacteraceae bacterium]